MVRIHPDPPEFAGAVAQLGEHLLCKQGVVGSIPFSSTSSSGPGAGRMQNPEASGSVSIVPFASGLLNQCYRLFFNNTEEVKQSARRASGDESLRSSAWSGMGWIVSSLLFPESSGAAGSANTRSLRACSSAQCYGVKRLSACGGCLGDYRR